MKPTIYIISGLGADKRMFQNFSFDGFKVIYMDWISPLENETLQNYAFRISENINDENAILIGLSFGGILAVEISKIKRFKNIFLLSSAKTKYEIPLYYRVLGKLNLLKFLPNSLLKQTNFITNYIFGAKTDFEKNLLKDIIKNTDAKFMRWSLNQIIEWKNKDFGKNIIHIQGNRDLILPHYFIKYDYLIETGTHFMTLNQSEAIEKIIIENLS